jgi:hypothetical protein
MGYEKMGRRSIAFLFVLYGATLTTFSQGPQQVDSLPHREDRFALLIGVDAYQNAHIQGLQRSSRDVMAIKDTLVRFGGFPEGNIIVLSTGSSPEYQPTRTNILAALDRLKRKVSEGGLLFFMFSGHGAAIGDKEYLLPSDAVVSEAGVPWLVDGTALPDDEIRDDIASTRAGQVIVILDACRDDPEPGVKGLSNNNASKAQAESFDFKADKSGVQASAVIYATEAGKTAGVDDKSKLSYLTELLTDGMQGKAAKNGGKVTLLDVDNYIKDSVPALVEIDHPGMVQKPVVNIYGYRAESLEISDPSKKVEIKGNINSDSSVSSADIDADKPIPLQPGTLDYLSLFAKYQTNELALGNLGEAAFVRGDYGWTIRFLEQARKIQGSKRWMKEYPYLAAAYWLSEGNQAKFVATLQAMIDDARAWETKADRDRDIEMLGYCVEVMRNILRTLPAGQSDQMASFISRVEQTRQNLAFIDDPNFRRRLCTVSGSSEKGGSRWSGIGSYLPNSADHLNPDYHQHGFQCCGGGAEPSSIRVVIPLGIEIETSGEGQWEVIPGPGWTLNASCSPTTGPQGTGCKVTATVFEYLTIPNWANSLSRNPH